MNTLLKHAAALLLSVGLLSSGAHAAVQTFDVSARENSLKPTETGVATGILLTAGETFTVTADPSDTWVLGSGATRRTNADGTTAFSPYTDPISGQTFLFGSLVGRIGTGDFFLIGTDFVGAANATGQLFLIAWDSNRGDNSEFIQAIVTTSTVVPLPPALGMMGLGLLGLVGLRRRRSA